MEVIPVTDLPKDKAMAALKKYREQYCNQVLPSSTLEQVYDKVGGRLSFLSRVAKSDDMTKTCDDICRAEKTWLLNKCWILGEEMDDDVMDEQKFSVSNDHKAPTYYANQSNYKLVGGYGPCQSTCRP
jgi:hypothetical protein